MNVDKPLDWERYPAGHPYEYFSQKDMYKTLAGNASNVDVLRVMPRLGIVR